jgi:hypothetical protein
MALPKRTRGLPSIARGREERGFGRGRWTTEVGIAAIVVLVGGTIAYRTVSNHDLNSRKDALFAKRRAVELSVGAEWNPLRDRIERRILEGASTYQGDLVDRRASDWPFRRAPGFYVRLRVADATDPERIRIAAAESKRDGFVGCLLTHDNPAAARGDLDAGAFPEQPWNLGQAYDALRVLTPAWATDVGVAADSMRLRVFEQQYDKAVRSEFPLAISMTKSVRVLVIALDEDVPEAGEHPTVKSLGLLVHPTRVLLVDLATDTVMVRLRRTATASVVVASGRSVEDPETRDAMTRQVRNCNLARQVLAELQ